jgi:hypothetical protein
MFPKPGGLASQHLTADEITASLATFARTSITAIASSSASGRTLITSPLFFAAPNLRTTRRMKCARCEDIGRVGRPGKAELIFSSRHPARLPLDYP